MFDNDIMMVVYFGIKYNRGFFLQGAKFAILSQIQKNV